MNEIEALLADPAVDTIEEHEMIALLASHRAQRDVVNRARLARGFPPLSDSPNVSRLYARTRCHGCKKLGHIRRDCPDNPNRGGGGAGGAPKVFAKPNFPRTPLGRGGGPRRCGRAAWHPVFPSRGQSLPGRGRSGRACAPPPFDPQPPWVKSPPPTGRNGREVAAAIRLLPDCRCRPARSVRDGAPTARRARRG